jgi:hypothetical protein
MMTACCRAATINTRLEGVLSGRFFCGSLQMESADYLVSN